MHCTGRSARLKSSSWEPTCARLFPATSRRSGGLAESCMPTACTGTVSCWRRRLPAGWRMPPSILHSSRRHPMRIFLNDDAHDVEPGTLAAALESLGFGGRKIATALNGRFVAAAARPKTALADGHRVEGVAPMQDATGGWTM